ncbi:hypothetical protein GCM10010435_16610 [Winogradskya consettensis]|uniref:Nucleotidyl transferase AbiEii/AbiGii toxin family protein n=1 Tax=Winogradskya consettensis TaxID=113560 RepID=A0A919SWN5_9ACTN|nr:nucleotidyl transferase AbiEii/AbiGii toxin family protein [Actinoplanes consettensis]GIM78831.1 hypothetical protein Aco04nite_62440 [Actinoplanes consettensis]
MTLGRAQFAAAAYVSVLTKVPQARVRTVFARLLESGTSGTEGPRVADFLAEQRTVCEAEFGPDGERLVLSLGRAWAADPPSSQGLAVWSDLPVSPEHPLADISKPSSDLAKSLSDRSRRIAREGKLPLDHVRRSVAIDRLMQRLMSDQGRDWILKGGTALASRRAVLGYTARKTLDLDAATHAEDVEDIIVGLDAAVSKDLEDGVDFRRKTVEHVKAQGKTAVRVKYDMYVGLRVWESVKVEVVQDTELTCSPVLAPASPAAADAHGWMVMPYRTVHPADHVADKWAGMTEVQPNGTPSSRFRDLLDLVTIVNSEVIEADDVIRACAQRRLRPGMAAGVSTLQLPAETWRAGYRKVAREAAKLGVPEAILLPEADEAVVFVAYFLNPVLAGTATGSWSPELHRWQS